MSASVGLVGAGPRAVALLARLVADHRVSTPAMSLTVHLIDPVDIGAGRTWRRDQHPLLLNNTYSAETTVFADETIPTLGATETGPSLAEWAAGLDDGSVPADGLASWTLTEARQIRPWTFPTRRFQGAYFRWALDRVVASAPPEITVVEHRTRVVSIDGGPAAPQRLGLEDGTRIEVDAVVSMQGLLTADHSPQERSWVERARGRGLVYLPPGMPTERDWHAVPAGETVLLRGLGANFFDALGLLFEGRGGRFTRNDDGDLTYQPSGAEPLVIAGSRHGLPYRAKAYYRDGLPEPVELPRLSAARERELIAAHGGRADLDYAGALAADVAADFAELYAVVARRTGHPEKLDWSRLVHPAAARRFADDVAWQRWLDRYLDDELHRIRHPDTSPDKTVHRAMETLRRRLSRLVLAGVFDPVSVIRDLKQTVLPDALVLASGPPPERLEQLVALRRAGWLELLGPGLDLDLIETGFAASTALPGQQREVRAVVEARMSLGDLSRSDDPLITALLAGGQARLHQARGRRGETVQTATLDVTGDHFLMIDSAGRPHPRRVVLGSPAGDVQWNAAIGAIPHTGDKFLLGAERTAVYLRGLLRPR